MIHDENNVLIDDQLVIVRDFLRTSKHAYSYIRNEHLVDLMYLIVHEVIIFFKWAKKDSLNVVIHPSIYYFTIFIIFKIRSYFHN